ncbi:squalene--hopene cyclase [Numidum massiliense]|uniref:squalene--hopene cyclase n=1 Tax=Numidum massiliense TaxID=1522315 RepID=UPI0006D561C3|nr:squalene--hopene cyclase [Numidum massiliense]
MREQIRAEIRRIAYRLQALQKQDGTWRMCFESGPMTDSFTIVLLRALNINDEPFIQKLAKRIASIQDDSGVWKLYVDEPGGNLSATVEAYYALLSSGYYKATDRRMIAAQQFIHEAGGLHKVGPMTKALLAATGQIPWPRHFKIPVEVVLLPLSFPLNFYDFSGYARVHLTPIFVAADRKFVLHSDNLPSLPRLLSFAGQEGEEQSYHALANEDNTLALSVGQLIQSVPLLPRQIHETALNKSVNYMLARIESDGTLYSYASATFLMIFALLAVGYPKNHPTVRRAVKGLKTLVCRTDNHIHLQNSTSTVWDTALLSASLQTAGLSASSQVVKKAGAYLLSRQQNTYADWSVHSPDTAPGGWGFSDINTINPDNDDTTAALRAIYRLSKKSDTYRHAFRRGCQWLLSMQNRDGGWAAFEKDANHELLRLIPIEGADAAATDPSTVDLTGRTLELFGNYAHLTVRHRAIRRGTEWLVRHQERDGSWYGRWGVCYIYGTWAALTGLRAVGVSPDHPAIARAAHWLTRIQNEDGGWGESCSSDVEKEYVPLKASTPSQTAWAVDALIAVHDEPTPTITRGIRYLLNTANRRDWTTTYPTGAGLPGNFYINYHSYRYIWPLVALGNYYKRYH